MSHDERLGSLVLYDEQTHNRKTTIKEDENEEGNGTKTIKKEEIKRIRKKEMK